MGIWLSVSKNAAHKGDQVTLKWSGVPSGGKLLVDNGWGPGNRWEVTGKTSDSDVHIIFDSGTTEQFFLVYQPDDGSKEQYSNCVYVKVKAPGEPVDAPPAHNDIGLFAKPTSAARGDKVEIHYDAGVLAKYVQEGFAAFINGGQGKEYPASENKPGTPWTIFVDPGTKQQFFITVRDGGGKPVCYSNTVYVSATKPKTASLQTWNDFNLQVDATEQATGETVKLTYSRSASLKDGQKIFVNCGQGYDWPEEKCPSGTPCHILVAPGETQQFFLVVKEGDTPVAYSNTCHVKAKGFPGLDKLNIDPAQLGPKIKLFGAFPMDEDVAGSGPSYKNISAQIERGKSLRLRWDIDGGLSALKITGPGVGPVTTLQQDLVVTPASDCNYLLEATNGLGQTSKATIWVAVHQPGEEWSYHVPLQPFTPEHVAGAKFDAEHKTAGIDTAGTGDIDWTKPKSEEGGEKDDPEKKEWVFFSGEAEYKSWDLKHKIEFEYFSIEISVGLALTGKTYKLWTLYDGDKEKAKEAAKGKLKDWWEENSGLSTYHPQNITWEGTWLPDADFVGIKGIKEAHIVNVTIFKGTAKFAAGEEAGAIEIGIGVLKWEWGEKDFAAFPISVEGKIPLKELDGDWIGLTVEASIGAEISLNLKLLAAEAGETAAEGAEALEVVGETVSLEAVGGILVAAVIVWLMVGALVDALTDADAELDKAYGKAKDLYRSAFKGTVLGNFSLPHDDLPEGMGEAGNPAKAGCDDANHYCRLAWDKMAKSESTRRWMGKRAKEVYGGEDPGMVDGLKASLYAGEWTSGGTEEFRQPMMDALGASLKKNIDNVMTKVDAQIAEPLKIQTILAWMSHYTDGGHTLWALYAFKHFYGIEAPQGKPEWKWYFNKFIPYSLYKAAQERGGGQVLNEEAWKKAYETTFNKGSADALNSKFENGELVP